MKCCLQLQSCSGKQACSYLHRAIGRLAGLCVIGLPGTVWHSQHPANAPMMVRQCVHALAIPCSWHSLCVYVMAYWQG